MKKLMLIASLIALMGCANPTMEPYGKFAVEKVSGLSKTIYSPVSGGDMYGADVTYFFLKNVGNASITNITLEITGVQKNIGTAIAPVYEAVTMPDAFTVNPGTLYELFPSGGGSVNQLIRIAVNHGEKVGGFGASSPIPYGEYRVLIDINGNSGGAPIETLQVQYTLMVYTASWEFGYYTDLAKKTGWTVIPLTNTLGATGPEIDFRNGTPVVRNTGNVPIEFSNVDIPYNFNIPDASTFDTIPVGGEKVMLITANTQTAMWIKTNNTVFDSIKWPGVPDTDYIMIEYYRMF